MNVQRTTWKSNRLSILYYGPCHKFLSKRLCVELEDGTSQILNDDWTLLPQMRYACSQLLAGAITMNSKKQAIIINTVEMCGRSRSKDVHRENFVNIKGVPIPSSLPPVDSKYCNTWATLLTDSDGKKLVIGSKEMDALVTSSLRLDTMLGASVGGTTINFDLNDDSAMTTAIFLNTDSIQKASILVKNPQANKINRFNLLHRFRQLRTKFQYPSTCLLCRSSSVFTDDIRSRPYSVYTFADYDGGGIMILRLKLPHSFSARLASNTKSILPKEFTEAFRDKGERTHTVERSNFTRPSLIKTD
ncbi:hypothetical protein DFQ28_008272 [Apophysomyces sp. BC1034]|nr:hypothetical protein DFQ29_007070 [Apophysomyces sp. BC1021]KAG0186130.1 hypothetical protein DFQ28_008272 [Apophysomyces sp. BC1034]